MAAGDTQITIAGNLVDDPELRFTPAGAAGGAVPGGLDAAVPRQLHGGVEGRRQPVPDLQRVAAGGGERGREPDSAGCGSSSRGGCGSGRMRPRKARSGPSTRSRSTTSAPRCGTPRPRSTGSPGPVPGTAAYGGGQRSSGGGRSSRRPGRRLRRRRPSADPWASDSPAATPTNHRSNQTQATSTDNPTIPAAGGALKEHHDGQATNSQAQEEGLRVLPGEDRLRRLQGHRPAPQVHLRPRQDPRPAGDRQLHAATSGTSRRRSRTPARWRCCRTRARLARESGR